MESGLSSLALKTYLNSSDPCSRLQSLLALTGRLASRASAIQPDSVRHPRLIVANYSEDLVCQLLLIKIQSYTCHYSNELTISV